MPYALSNSCWNLFELEFSGRTHSLTGSSASVPVPVPPVGANRTFLCGMFAALIGRG